jgi:hypothetical protein
LLIIMSVPSWITGIVNPANSTTTFFMKGKITGNSFEFLVWELFPFAVYPNSESGVGSSDVSTAFT